MSIMVGDDISIMIYILYIRRLNKYMKQDRGELVKVLLYAIDLAREKNTLDKVYELAQIKLGKYIRIGRVKQIFRGFLPVNTLEVSELYYITLLINYTKLLNINVDEFFTDTEIKEAMNIDPIMLGDSMMVLELENVLAVGNDIDQQWITVLPNQEIGKMYHMGVLNYNYATQRKAKISKYRGKITPQASVNMKNVREIQKCIVDGTFYPNTITLNIMANGEESFVYDEKHKKLTIYLDTTQIDVIDGYHRTLGIYRAWKKNNNIEGHMIINIKHLTVKDARNFIAQEAKGNFNNSQDSIYYDSNGVISKIISEINKNKDEENIFKNRILMGNSNGESIVYYDTFASVLKAAWYELIKNASKMEILEVSEYICDFYIITYGIIKDKFKVETIDELKGTMALDQMLLSGWLYVAKKLYVSDGNHIGKDTREKIKKIIDKVDFETESDKNKFTYNDSENNYEIQAYEKSWMDLA